MDKESPKVVDIRNPRDRQSPKKKRSGYFSRAGWIPDNRLNIKPARTWLKNTVLALVILPLALVAVYSGYLWANKDSGLRSASAVLSGLKTAISDLLAFKTDSVAGAIAKVGGNLDELEDLVKYLKIAPILKEAPLAVEKTKQLVGAIALLNDNLVELEARGVEIAFKGANGRFLELLKEIRENVVLIKTSSAELMAQTARLDNSFKTALSDYVVLSTSLDRADEGLGALIAILSRPGKTYFALQFENPYEIRPAGGFSGSYGYIVFEGGEITDIQIGDTYESDKFLSYKIIPPFQLQTITAGWGARDANWFFDFPVSARKFTELLEASDMFRDENIEFEGVLAINARVMEGILGIVGDVEVPEYELTLNSANFLREIQEEVKEGRVLSFAFPLIIERLKSLPDEQKEPVFEALTDRYANKDIKLYFKDVALQSILVQHGLAGEVFKVPSRFDGDYLAVVNANVAGGKSDAFMNQQIKLDSFIDGAGEVRNVLKITRTHSGADEKEWWYRETNQNFIKVFTLPNSRLAYVNGSGKKTIRPQINYGRAGYVPDEDLAAMESTLSEMPEHNIQRYEEFGKVSYGTWFNVPKAQTKTLEMSYFNSRKVVAREGFKYTFVFDKQSGAESAFEYSIEAPAGYVWAQSGSPAYHYSSNSLPARLVLELTLRHDR